MISKASKIPKPEAAIRRYSVKNKFLKISQNLQENTCAGVSFLIMLAQAFSSDFCKIFKNTNFVEHPQTDVSAKWSIFNHVHNILRLFDGWTNFSLTTSKIETWLLVIKRCKRVALRLKEIRNIRKISL